MTPLFLQFINNEVSVEEMLFSFGKSSDETTRKAVAVAMENPPDLSGFREELTECVNDIIKEGFGEEFKAFVNNYMEPSLIEDVTAMDTVYGENVSRVARVKDIEAPWVQGLLCYNLCLYIKAFGTECLKKCKICGKPFAHKGKYALYCSDNCKREGQKLHAVKEKTAEKPKLPGLNLGAV